VNTCSGFVSVLLTLPSPKFHWYVNNWEPVEVSLNRTDNGDNPDSGVAVKSATGAITGGGTSTLITANFDDTPALLEAVRVMLNVVLSVAVKVCTGFLSVEFGLPSPKFHR